jgi:uncharacterized protein RhaS with RHS repeats
LECVSFQVELAYYNYFMDYDPQTGRHVESDLIGLEGGINTYAYVDANPISGFDPLGLDNWAGVGRPALVYTLMSEASEADLEQD